MSFGSAAAVLVGVALIGQLLGFLRNRFISTNFTVTDPGASDAFFAAFAIPDFFFFTIAAGALGVAFMPVIADRLEVNDKAGVWRIASSLINILAVAMVAIGLLIFIFAEPITRLLFSDLPARNFEEAVMMMRIIALNPLLFTVSGIFFAVQQSFGRFFFYAIGPLIYNLAIIASIFIFKDNIGIIGLAIGAVLGAVLQLGLAYSGMRDLGFQYSLGFNWRNKHVKSVVRQLPPRSLDQGIDQVNSIVEVNRALALQIGAASYYSFALALHYVPIMLIGNSIATAAFPRLTERLAQGRPDLFRKDFLRILRLILWITAPVAVICYYCRGYLGRLIYGDAAPIVSLIFGYLVVAIIFRIIYAMVSRWFYAQKDTKTPLFVSIFAISLNIFLAFQLAHPDSYGVVGLALAQSIVAVVEVLILVAIMVGRDHRLFDLQFGSGVLKIISVTGFSLVAAFIMISLLPFELTDRGIVTLGSKLAIISAVTFTVHVAVSLLFELEEAKAAVGHAKKIIFRTIKV